MTVQKIMVIIKDGNKADNDYEDKKKGHLVASPLTSPRELNIISLLPSHVSVLVEGSTPMFDSEIGSDSIP